MKPTSLIHSLIAVSFLLLLTMSVTWPVGHVAGEKEESDMLFMKNKFIMKGKKKKGTIVIEDKKKCECHDEHGGW